MSEQLKKLAEVAEINPRRKTVERADNAPTSFVPMEAVDDVLGEITQIVSQPFSKVRKGYTYFENGDVIFAKITPCMQNGKHAVVGNLIDGFGFGSTEFHVVRASPEILPEWIHYFLRRKETLDAAIKTFTGTVGQQRVPPSFLENLELPVPPVEEQRQIAARLKAQLSEVETAWQAAQAQMKDFGALQAAICRDAYCHVIPVAVPSTIDDGVPDGWRWRKLTDIARLESGHTPSRLRPDWWDGDVSWVSLTEIRALDGKWVERTQLRTNEAGISNSAARILPRGTVCFSRTASVGFVTIMGAPMATSQDFANWVCGDELEPEFLMHALIRSRKELRDLATGATHKTIYMPTLESFHVCAPLREEQQRIVERLKAQLAEVETARQAAQAQLAEIKCLPQRLLAQAFDTQGNAS
jgi:type I restriction enzyme S subunit